MDGPHGRVGVGPQFALQSAQMVAFLKDLPFSPFLSFSSYVSYGRTFQCALSCLASFFTQLRSNPVFSFCRKVFVEIGCHSDGRACYAGDGTSISFSLLSAMIREVCYKHLGWWNGEILILWHRCTTLSGSETALLTSAISSDLFPSDLVLLETPYESEKNASLVSTFRERAFFHSELQKIIPYLFFSPDDYLFKMILSPLAWSYPSVTTSRRCALYFSEIESCLLGRKLYRFTCADGSLASAGRTLFWYLILSWSLRMPSISEFDGLLVLPPLMDSPLPPLACNTLLRSFWA
uniref:VP9b n=1 Tax=Shelly headland virus TaxID=2485879 RepID=A0A3G3BTL6_9VIRU|nr:VP9b [Shelly headland virus]